MKGANATPEELEIASQYLLHLTMNDMDESSIRQLERVIHPMLRLLHSGKLQKHPTAMLSGAALHIINLALLGHGQLEATYQQLASATLASVAKTTIQEKGRQTCRPRSSLQESHRYEQIKGTC